MIEFFPNNLKEADFKSKGEFKLYKKFKEYEHTRDWIIYHSQELHHHHTQFMGEIDFIIIIPGKGVLVVEVKDHKSIDFEPETGNWYLGRDVPTKKSPFKQARDNRISLYEYFKNKYQILKEVLFWDVVVFTSGDLEQKSNISWKRYEYINSSQIISSEHDDFMNLFEKVLIEAWGDNYNKIKISEDSPNRNHIELLKDLRKKITFKNNSKIRDSELDEELDKAFTVQQRRVLELFAVNKKCVIQGPPGTGKTLIAIEHAKRLAAQNKTVLFLCYNKMLGDFYKSVFLAINAKFGRKIHFYTMNKLLLEINAEREWNDQPSKEKFENLPLRALERLDRGQYKFMSGMFQNLIIDEGQDIIMNDIYVSIIDKFLNKGIDETDFYIFGDFFFQNIQNFENRREFNDFIEIYRPTNLPLIENCRNSPDVIDIANAFCKFGKDPYDKRYLRENKISRPEILPYNNNIDQLIKLKETIIKLLNQEFKSTDIVILTMMTDETSCLTDLKDINFVKTNKLDILLQIDCLKTTIRKFKGLEKKVVIITDINKLDDHQDRSILFTGITRCIDKLVLLFHKDVRKKIDII